MERYDLSELWGPDDQPETAQAPVEPAQAPTTELPQPDPTGFCGQPRIIQDAWQQVIQKYAHYGIGIDLQRFWLVFMDGVNAGRNEVTANARRNQSNPT